MPDDGVSDPVPDRKGFTSDSIWKYLVVEFDNL